MKGNYVYGYCHGFLSNAASAKGVYLAKVFRETFGINLHLLDLNGGNDIAKVTTDSAIKAIDALYFQANGNQSDTCKLRLVGSSMGGYMSALYASLFTDRVDKLLLLCPAMGLQDIIQRLVSSHDPNGMKNWESTGFQIFPRPNAIPTYVNVPYSFFTSLTQQPAFPQYQCQSIIVQGIKDSIVTVDDISNYFNVCPEQKRLTQLILVDDDHYLLKSKSLDEITDAAKKLFEL